jgi:hypothetical protein
MENIERDRGLIESLGGPAKVSDLLGLDRAGGVQRVQNWKSRGIPAAVKVSRPDLFMRGLFLDIARPTPAQQEA